MPEITPGDTVIGQIFGVQLVGAAVVAAGVVAAPGVVTATTSAALTKAPAATTVVVAAGGGAAGVGATAEGAALSRGVSVLGHYPGYVNLAQSMGARYFSVPSNVWAGMSAAEQWAANTRFLERLVLRGDVVVLATPAMNARPGSAYAMELEYLFSRGYSLNGTGTRMLPPGR